MVGSRLVELLAVQAKAVQHSIQEPSRLVQPLGKVHGTGIEVLSDVTSAARLPENVLSRRLHILILHILFQHIALAAVGD